MTEKQSNPHIGCVPEGWDVEVSREGDFVRYRYTERSTGESIEGAALVAHFDSPEDDIREFIRQREERERLEAAGVNGGQIARKILEMVGQLHHAGFESLYIDPYMAPSGCYWRYSIGIAANGKWPQRDSLGSMNDGGPEGSIGGGFEQQLAWCTPADSVEEYTRKFIQQYAKSLGRAETVNPSYVQWYREMLTKTSPSGILIFGCDMGSWYEYAFTWGKPEDFRSPCHQVTAGMRPNSSVSGE